MAQFIARGVLGLVGSTGAYGAYLHFSKPVEKQFVEEVLMTPVSKKAALAATTVGVLAMSYLLIRKARSKKPTEMPIKMSVKITEESVVEGSELTERITPGCQGFIAIKKAGKEGEELEIVGCCFKTAYGIWVPSHVLGNEPEKTYIIGRRLTRSAKGGETEYYYPQVSLEKYFDAITDQVQFGAEMCCIPLDSRDSSVLGLSEAKMTVLGQKSMVTIVGPAGKSSMGELVPTSVMGMVRYYGTTLAGFSGAPYMLNGRVVGVHLHGGAGGNGGQEISYLNQLYKIERGISEESSFGSNDTGAKVMELAFKNNKKIQVEEQGDFVVFRDDTGHYHRCLKTTYQDYETRYKSSKYQDLDGEDWADDSSEDSADYYRGDPEEYDRFHKRGKYEESRRYHPESKKPFLGKYPVSRKSAPPSATQPIKKSRTIKSKIASVEKHLKYLKNTLEKSQNGKKPEPCPPPTPVQPERSTVSSSSSPAGQ